MAKRVPLTLSSWTLGDKISFEDRVKMAKEVGYDGIGLRYENYADALKAGLTDEDMLNILKKHDYKVTEVEYITCWAADEDMDEAQQTKEKGTYHMAKLFGVGHINCGLLEHYPVEQLKIKFKELCERAGDLIIALEFMPYSSVGDLNTAWELVKYADRDNAMVMLDSWHWFRANEKFENIKQVPAEKIISIQINDINEEAYPKDILRDESMKARLNPGEGYGDIVGFLKMIKDHGVDPKVMGAEVISHVNLDKGIEYAAKSSYEGSIKVLKEAWPEILN